MISTTHLTGDQLAQLDALLADTTPGGGTYRPPVARDPEVMQQLEQAGLVRYVEDISYETYEVTDAGRALVIDRAIDAAHTQVFVLYADDDELRAAIENFKLEAARYLDSEGNTHLRERVLADIEACQDELDRRDADGPSESTGRHRAVPADDRPTETIARVELPTEQLPSVGTLPGLPVVESVPLDVVSPDYGEKLWAAIKGADTGEDVYDEFVAETTGEWAALEADLGDDRSWLHRNLTPRRVLALSIVVTVVLTWFAAWLVMG